MMDISIPYYEDLTRISNSNIGWFLQKGPAFLHKMLTDPPPEEKNPVLERGTMIHEYLLQPEEFQKDYVIWDKSRPSSAQQEKFCQAYASSLEIEPNKAILEAYKAAYSTKGKTEETMLSEGSKIASTLKDYIDYLKSGDQRIMIGPYDYQMLKKIRNNVEAHKLAKTLLWPSGYGTPYKFEEGVKETFGELPIEVYHEFHINWEAGYGMIDLTEYYPVKCKSLLDSLTLDFKNKKATIMDLKTTAKLWHFEESIEMYDYCRQLCYYTRAVEWYLEEELHEKSGDWTFEYYIIGIDTTGSNEIRVFKINEDDVEARDNTICDALGEIAWHQINNKWDHSRAYYEGDGSETLNL
jgi:hypothetical protein